MAIVPFILPQIAACTTSAGQNIQIPRVYNGNSFIFSGNGSPMKNSYSGNSTFSFDSCDFLLNNILLVVGTICIHDFSVHKFCVNNNTLIEYYSQRVMVRDRSTNAVYELPLQIKRSPMVIWGEKVSSHI